MSPGKRLSPRSTRRFRVRSVLCLVCQCDDNGFIARNAGWRVDPRRASLNSVRSLSSVVNAVLPVTCLLYSACERTARQHRGCTPFWQLVRDSAKFFLLATLAAFALRLLFYLQVPTCRWRLPDLRRHRQELARPRHLRTDPRRWLCGRPGSVCPVIPAFLAACFLLFGREHYNAVLLVQIVIDVATCFVIADLARRTVSNRAARFAFLLAALCPFTANYTVAPLAETLSIFFAAVALDAAVAGFSAIDEGLPGWTAWTCCGLAMAAGILLRPDGGILLMAIGLVPALENVEQPAAPYESLSGRDCWSWPSRLRRWFLGRSATGAISIASCRWSPVGQ